MGQVHTHFVRAVLVCIAAVGVCYPRLGDKSRASALHDLGELSQQVDIHALERALARDAERKLATDLKRVKDMVGVGRLSVAKESKVQSHLLVAEPPHLSTLEGLALATRPDAQVAVRGPSLSALTSSLRWRLDRAQGRGRLTLTDLQLSHPIGAEVLEAEARVDPAREAFEGASAAQERARESYFAMREVSDHLSQRATPKKSLLSATRDRVTAWEEFEKTRQVMEAQRGEYDRLAKEALTLSLAAPHAPATGVLVLATLQTDEGKPLELKIPVPLHTQNAATFANTPTALARLQQSPIWREISALTPEAARTQLHGELSFHLREAQLSSLTFRGTMALQVLPLLLGLMVWLLTLRCRAVSRGCGPFGYFGLDIPTPGTGRPMLDSVLLIAPPTLACALTCWTLLRLDAQLWIAVVFGMAAIAQSVMAARALRELEDVRAGAQNRSLIPPLPVRPQAV